MRLRFEVLARPGDVRVAIPYVDGRSLVQLAAAYEAERGYAPTGGYDGLAPDSFICDSLAAYFHGEDSVASADGQGRFEVIGCECGQWGCWPLACRIEADTAQVTWSDFAQPHRPARDYAGFGPFVFERAGYDAAVFLMASKVAVLRSAAPAPPPPLRGAPPP
jgi:hypothetical protein